MPTLERLVDAGRSVRRAIRAMTGEDAYDRYLAFERAAHPHCVPMSEREFWRERMDAQDTDPGGRCC